VLVAVYKKFLLQNGDPVLDLASRPVMEVSKLIRVFDLASFSSSPQQRTYLTSSVGKI